MRLSFKTDPKRALESYRENGYFIEEGVLSSRDCEELIKAGMDLPGVKAGDYRPAMQPHRQNPGFLKGMCNPEVVRTIEQLVGGKAVGLQTEFFYGKPGVKGFSNHQDNFFVEAEADTFASAWIALVDVGPKNGGLIGYPRSHKAGRLPVRKVAVGTVEGQDPNANNEESVVPSQYKQVDLIVPKGSAVFIHSQFVHGSRMNQTKDYRFVLLCTYIRQGAGFRAGRYAQREPIALQEA